MQISLSSSIHLDHSSLTPDTGAGGAFRCQEFVPLGLLSLHAAARARGLDADVRVVEVNGLLNRGEVANDGAFHLHLAAAVCRPSDRVVGLMTDADSLAHTVAVARYVRRLAPEAHILLGGPASSPLARPLLEAFPFLDSVALGEAEDTFVELLETLRDGTSPGAVAGLVWRDGARVVTNPTRPLIDDLDTLPIPSFDVYETAGPASLYLDIGRGCPFKCEFCCTAPFWSRAYRMKSTDRILEELVLLRDTYGRTHVNFSHDIFTFDRDWTREFCRRLQSENLGITWTCSTRTDVTSPELIAEMARAGCVEVYYGIEAGGAAAQRTISKNLDLDRSREILRATAAAGIRPVTGFIVGYPFETVESFRNTLDEFFHYLENGAARTHLFGLCPFPQSPMYGKHSSAVNRPAAYFDLPLTAESSGEIEALPERETLFCSTMRYSSPDVPAAWIDACEEVSCHLVTLKSLWRLVLPLYARGSIEWFEAWVEWIEARNRELRPESRFSHYGDARDLLDFVAAELHRMGLAGSDLMDLVIYERSKIEALSLGAPLTDGAAGVEDPAAEPLRPDSLVRRRCSFLSHRFEHDLAPLLAGARAPEPLPPDERRWTIFAKSSPSWVDVLQVGALGKTLLDSCEQPIPVTSLLGRGKEVRDEVKLEILHGLRDRALLTEVRP